MKWCSELLLCVPLEDKQKRKDVYKCYIPYGHSIQECLHLDIQIGHVGSWKGTDFLQLLEQGELLLPSTGAPARSTKSSVLCPPSEALSPLPFPSRSCAPSTTLKILLFILPSPTSTHTLEVSPGILLMLSRECLL